MNFKFPKNQWFYSWVKIIWIIQKLKTCLFYKKCQVKWIITTSYIAIKYEGYIDNFLEDCSISDVNYLDIVTTSFTYIKLNNQIAEEIVNEFINISCIGLIEYQLVSFLNLNNHEERRIYNLINNFLYKSKDLDIVSS